MKFFGEQLVEYENPKPLAVDDNIVEDVIKSQAALKFHLNLIKHIHFFVVSTKGYEFFFK